MFVCLCVCVLFVENESAFHMNTNLKFYSFEYICEIATIELYGDSTIVECNGSAEDRKILLDCLQKASSSATR